MSDNSLEKYLRGNVYWVRGTRPDTERYVRESLGTSDPEIADAKIREIYAEARKRRILGPDAPKPEDEITFAACVLLYHASDRDALYLKPIVRKIGKTRVRDLTAQAVRQLGRDLYPDGSTDTWQRQVVTPIRSVINNAHELGKCAPLRVRAYDKNERMKQDRARGKESRIAKVPGSWPWVLAFCEHADPRDAALCYFMFRHGYRIGQSVAMTKKHDLDLSAGQVRVHAAKGHAGHWVKLDPEEVVMIANLPPSYRHGASDRVFGIGNARNGALYRRWKSACERAGIAYLPPHAAGRHGYATETIVRQGLDPVSAAENLWADPNVMLKTYAHSDDAQARIEAAMRAGKAAASTPAVQPKTGSDPKRLAGK